MFVSEILVSYKSARIIGRQSLMRKSAGLAINQSAIEFEGTSEAVLVSSDLTYGVGTTLYIAPETMDSKMARLKSMEKIDVYSFGRPHRFYTLSKQRSNLTAYSYLIRIGVLFIKGLLPLKCFIGWKQSTSAIKSYVI